MMGSNRVVRATLLLWLAAVTVGVIGAKAWAWPWDKKGAYDANLSDIMKNPEAYLGRTLQCKARFALRGKLFKDFNTRFNAGEHANFAVWPLKAQLWEKAQRRNVLPTLYINKSVMANLRVLNQLKRYDVIEIRGQVVSTYAGLPWILVDGLTKVKLGEGDHAMADTTLVHIRRGVELLNDGKGSIAARHLEMAVDGGVPADHKEFVLRKLGMAYKESGDLAKAEKTLTESLDLAGDVPETYLRLAEIQLTKGNAAGVIDNCKKVMELSADFPEAHGLMGEAYSMEGKTNMALEQCDLAKEVKGLSARDKAMVEVRRARVLVRAKRYADAVRAYAQAIGEGPLGAEAWLRKEIGGLYESRYDATGNAKNLEEAEREYANANVLSNNADAEGLFLAARVAYKGAKVQEAGTFAKAKELLDTCTALDGSYTPAQVLLAQIYIAENNPGEAKKIFERLMQNGAQDAKTLLGVATAYEQLNMTAEAKQAYAAVIEKEPQNRMALEKHAALSEKTEDAEGAKRSLAALVDLYPDDPAYAMRLGKLYFEGGDYATAAQILETAAQAANGPGEAAGILQGRAWALAGNEGNAEAALRRVLKTDPKNAEAMGRLAMLLADQGKKGAEALSLAAKAHDKNPGDAMYADILGWAQVQAGQAEAAVKTLSGIAAEKRGRLAWYHLAVAEFKAGNLAAARTAAEKAMSPKQAGERDAVVDVISSKAKALLEQISKAEKQAQRDAEKIEKRLAREEARLAKAKTREEEQRLALEKETQQIQNKLEGIDAKEEKTETESETETPKPDAPLPTKLQAEEPKDDRAEAEVWVENTKPEVEAKAAKKPGVGDVDIPGVVEPDFESDIQTMTGPKKAATNTVRNVPNPTEKAEEPEPAAKTEAAPPAATEEPPMPTISIEWEKTKEKKAEEKTEKKAEAEPAKKKELPHNDINSLPDWAK